jgi:diaminohydroxyphosphoribosylaminopyrimidine deaminase/5-amino-6-(5-phosphoribosylamino)uracil reductase
VSLKNGIQAPAIKGDTISEDRIGEDTLRIIKPYAV